MSRLIHNAVVAKVAITTGIALYYALPPGWDAASALAANVFWIWRF